MKRTNAEVKKAFDVVKEELIMTIINNDGKKAFTECLGKEEDFLSIRHKLIGKLVITTSTKTDMILKVLSESNSLEEFILIYSSLLQIKEELSKNPFMRMMGEMIHKDK